MSELQKSAIDAYDKLMAERGEVTFLDAFVAGVQWQKEQKSKDLNEPVSHIHLDEEQTGEVAEKFFDDVYYGSGENYICIDGPVKVDDILRAADYIRQIALKS